MKSPAPGTRSAEPKQPIEEIFSTVYYPEVKDLGKGFLTLLSAVLAFSVTFSKSILGPEPPALAGLVCLIAAWAFFLLAITAAGAGIYTNFISLNRAQRSMREDPRRKSAAEERVTIKNLIRFPYRLMTTAGVCFVIGLVLLAASGGLQLFL
ncbi:MAG: hypothetical protein JXB85_05235 [Anaerolineales bacterium]|nr:hypothetical protein [Anaerolineales bacterium]